MRSSYEQNNYGDILKTFVITMKPMVAVECGVLDGYSALHLGYGVKVIRKLFGMHTSLECYDLWDAYDYNHGDMYEVNQLLKEHKLDNFVKLNSGDAFNVYKCYGDETVDLLHFDISNDGNKLAELMETWNYKIRPGGVILFEGGSLERDEIGWMKEYNKKPIYPELNENQVIKDQYKWFVYTAYPSLTALFKKGGCLSCDLL